MISPTIVKRHVDAQTVLWDRLIELGYNTSEIEDGSYSHMFGANSHLCYAICETPFTAADIPLLIEACSACGSASVNCWYRNKNLQFIENIRS